MIFCIHYVAAQNTTLPTDFTIPECTPNVEVNLETGEFDHVIKKRIEELFEELFKADQLEREIVFSGKEPSPEETMSLLQNDLDRRLEIFNYIQNKQVASGKSFYHAAFIFQHGDCPKHYEFANSLALKALELNYEQAKWIYAATLDRYLRSIGEKQKFGTQYTSSNGCEFELAPYDLNTTDEERKAYNIPTLAEALARAEALGHCSD